MPGAESLGDAISRLLKYGLLSGLAGLLEGAGILEAVLASMPLYSEGTVLHLVNALESNARRQLEMVAESDHEVRRLWEVIDLSLAIMRGIVRFGLAYDPRGFDAINDYEISDWLRINGASERSLNSAFMRGLYSLALAYDDGDFQRPCVAAGQGLRGALRMFFPYRGDIFWKMRAGMGDVVFAPFYEVLSSAASGSSSSTAWKTSHWPIARISLTASARTSRRWSSMSRRRSRRETMIRSSR
jgi:hypothetical protein